MFFQSTLAGATGYGGAGAAPSFVHLSVEDPHAGDALGGSAGCPNDVLFFLSPIRVYSSLVSGPSGPG